MFSNGTLEGFLYILQHLGGMDPLRSVTDTHTHTYIHKTVLFLKIIYFPYLIKIGYFTRSF